MIDKTVRTMAEAMAGVTDGMVVVVGGFGAAGQPNQLIDALIETGVKDLTVAANNVGGGDTGLSRLIGLRRVRKMICSFPRSADPGHFVPLYRAGEIELDLVPQGTLAERIRAAGAGIGAFFTPTAAGTMLARDKETRMIDGRLHVLEHALRTDLALIEAWRADRWGNLTYNKSARNFNPIMAMAGRLTVVQTQHMVELGALDPEAVVTPGIFVDRVIHVPYAEEVSQ